MTVSTTEVAAPDIRPDRKRGSSRFTLAVGALALLALTALMLTRPGRAGYLDAAAVDPSGSRAIATLLRDQGVEVRQVRTTAETLSLAPRATVLITDSSLPTDKVVNDLIAAAPARVILVAASAGQPVWDRLAAGVTLAEPFGMEVLKPHCALSAASQSGPASLPGPAYDARAWKSEGDGSSVATCYERSERAAVVLIPKRPGRPEMLLLGSAYPLTNAGLTEQGNAALALNLLGAGPDLVWWRPSPTDPALAADLPVDPLDLLPVWVVPGIVQLFLASIAVAWWRGRRLGPVVVEALPVVIAAGETSSGRARLLQSQRARGQAAEHVRDQALARLKRQLGVPPGATPEATIGATAQRSGRAPNAVAALLYGPQPMGDDALIRLIRDLDALQVEVSTFEGST